MEKGSPVEVLRLVEETASIPDHPLSLTGWWMRRRSSLALWERSDSAQKDSEVSVLGFGSSHTQERAHLMEMLNLLADSDLWVLMVLLASISCHSNPRQPAAVF